MEVNSREDGCYLHDHCLTCPLPECIYDHVSGRGKRPRNIEREGRVLQMSATGLSNRLIAKTVGIDPHTVAEILRRAELANAG